MIFDGSKSHDPDGNIIKWFWMFGDNTNATGETVQHIYTEAGTYTITLTVTDNEGAKHIDTTTCVITQPNRPPTTPIITGPTSGTKNTMYTYMVVSRDEDNDTIRYTIVWGDETSYVNSSTFLPSGTSFNFSHRWTTAGKYVMTVTVTDNQTNSFSEKTVWIDAISITDNGYLIDVDGDGLYDFFYDETTSQRIPVGRDGESYLIDSNGDDKWDYTFDPIKGLTDYKEPTKGPSLNVLGISIFIAIIVCIVIVVVLFWKKGYVKN